MQYYGVSPAYFISSFTDRFTPDNVVSALSELRSLGYHSVELEVYHPETLDEWERGGFSRVIERAKREGLSYPVFVAHFLLHAFTDAPALSSSWGVAECKRVIRMLDRAQACHTVVVPLPPFRLGAAGTGSTTRPATDRHLPRYTLLWQGLVAKVAAMAEIVAASGRRLALEIMPGALLSGSDGFLRLRDAVATAAPAATAAQGTGLGYNFDTGHAWAQGEPVWLIPEKLGGALCGTHLCDNDGANNASLCPGDGTVPWPETVNALERAAYAKPLDIEIKCDPSRVRSEYARALEYISALQTSAKEVPS